MALIVTILKEEWPSDILICAQKATLKIVLYCTVAALHCGTLQTSASSLGR